MPDNAGFIRDYGILPTDLRPPDGVVRSVMPWWHVVVQYTLTTLAFLFGLGFAAVFAFTMPAKIGVPIATGVFATTLGLIYFVCRNDTVWVELDGDTIRAKHLYTRHIWERSVEEVADVLTLTYSSTTFEAVLVEAMLGRFRGVTFRFRDGRRPIAVFRADPGMKRARELIEAVLYRMSEHGPLDVELTNRDRYPMVRRIFWKADVPW